MIPIRLRSDNPYHDIICKTLYLEKKWKIMKKEESYLKFITGKGTLSEVIFRS